MQDPDYHHYIQNSAVNNRVNFVRKVKQVVMFLQNVVLQVHQLLRKPNMNHIGLDLLHMLHSLLYANLYFRVEYIRRNNNKND